MANSWPPNYTEIIARRARLLNEIRSSDKKRNAFKLHYSNPVNFVDFINDWFWTYDPRAKVKTIPFILFPKQADLIRWLNARYIAQEDGVVEKSREVGMSWLCCAYAVCRFIFEPEFKCGFGSRKVDLVDQLGNPDAIFEKIRFILKKLPPELRPNYQDNFCKIINLDNGSSLIGEGGDNIGRGGRNSMYFKDEAAFYERPMKIEAALSENSPVKIDVSTSNGPGIPFYDKIVSGVIPRFRIHWRDDPRKDEVWYKRKCETLPAFVVAREIDIDHLASVQDVVIPAKYVQACVGFELPRTGKKRASWDVADEFGVDNNALSLAHGVVVDSVRAWNGKNTTESARIVWNDCRNYGAELIYYDSTGVGAGARGGLSDELRIEKQSEKENKYNPKIQGVSSGESPIDGSLIEGKKNVDMFAKLKDQLWWAMRLRCQKTYEHRSGIKQYDHDELCSLPNDPILISQLSQATWSLNEAGKIRVDKYGESDKSPDSADSVVNLFKPEKKIRVL